MPIYEYQCGKCGHRLETIQKMSDEPLKDCPECGAAALEKLVSAAAFRLKGGGWYETDFKSGNKRNVAQSDSKGGKKEAASDSKKDKKSAKGGAKGKVATSSKKKSSDSK